MPRNTAFSPLSSSSFLFSCGTCEEPMQPKILKWLTSGFLPLHVSSGVLDWTAWVDFYSTNEHSSSLLKARIFLELCLSPTCFSPCWGLFCSLSHSLHFVVECRLLFSAFWCQGFHRTSKMPVTYTFRLSLLNTCVFPPASFSATALNCLEAWTLLNFPQENKSKYLYCSYLWRL